MKKAVSVIIMAFLILSWSVTTFSTNINWWEEYEEYILNPDDYQYSDVSEEHWAHKEIMSVSMRGYFSGYGDGTFRPNNYITRAEAIKVLTFIEGLHSINVSETSYADVALSDWFAPYVENGKYLMHQKDMGSGKRYFYPNEFITREDTVYAILKILGFFDHTYIAEPDILDKFSDKDKISSGYEEYVATAVTIGLINGRTDGTIGAHEPLTRAEFATLIYRINRMGFFREWYDKIEQK